MPKSSIITPVFIDTIEKIDWLKEMIQSVLNQTLTDFEVILIDDNSTIPYGELSQIYNDNRLRWIKGINKKQGPALLRNTAVALSQSDCILPVDSDDILADDKTLEIMYNIWNQDRKKFVYGNLQMIEDKGNGFEKSNFFDLGTYTFERSMDLRGVMPVSCMHSKEAHYKAGGWKKELEYGIEDVEYWIAMGKAGFCGQKIAHTTLLYRKHQKSRQYSLTRIHNKENEMRNLIIKMHSDVYEGRYPMGCCGGGSVSTPSNKQAIRMSVPPPKALQDYPESDKLWIEYAGERKASFGVIGQYTGIRYVISGTGTKVQVHKNDTSKFRRSGRGKDFKIDVLPPEEFQLPEKKESNPPYIAPEPQLATILQLDETATKSGIQSQQVNGNASLSDLNLGALEDMLVSEGWTIDKLKSAKPEQLTPLKGIGTIRAQLIIEKANRL